jgi:hypothetical protein
MRPAAILRPRLLPLADAEPSIRGRMRTQSRATVVAFLEAYRSGHL